MASYHRRSIPRLTETASEDEYGDSEEKQASRETNASFRVAYRTLLTAPARRMRSASTWTHLGLRPLRSDDTSGTGQHANVG